KAQALARKTLGPAHPTTSHYIAALMSVEAALGKWERAGKLALESRKITRSYIAHTLPALSPEEQLNFLVHNNSWQTYRAVSLGLHADAHPELAPLTAEILANYKGLAQESLAERTALALGAADPTLKAGLAELNSLRSRLAALAQGGGTDADFKQLEKL